MGIHLHFFPELPQGKLDMPPCGAACLLVPLADFFLRFVLEVVKKNFFLRPFRQQGEGGGKIRVTEYHGLSAHNKGIFLVHWRLCEVFICGTERDKPFLGQIFKGDFPDPPCPQHTGGVYGGVTYDNLAKGIVRVLDMLFVGFKIGHGISLFL